MDWTLWRPDPGVLTSIVELLQEALIPDSTIQCEVQKKLTELQTFEQLAFYLFYVLLKREGCDNASEDMRSLSGILLKNSIASVYKKLSAKSVLEMQQLCLGLLSDPCRDVRNSISAVIVMLLKCGGEDSWTSLIPTLLMMIANGGRYESDMALVTLFNFCDTLSNDEGENGARNDTNRLNEINSNNNNIGDNNNNSNNGLSTDNMGALQLFKMMYPILMQNIGGEHGASTVRLLNGFLSEHYVRVRQHVDLGAFVKGALQTAQQGANSVANSNPEFHKNTCQCLTLMLDFREQCLLTYLSDVMMYVMHKTVDSTDSDVVLRACEFWLALTTLEGCREIMTPYLAQLLPVLLKNMKYSPAELQAMNDEPRPSSESYPFNLHGECRKGGGGERDMQQDDDDDDVGEEVCGDICGSDDNIGWTLRKCSAATLDSLSLKFNDDLLPMLMGQLNELLAGGLLEMESGILALGAISEGCKTGLEPHLGQIVQFLFQSLNHPQAIIRVIICWTLSRFSSWMVAQADSQDPVLSKNWTCMLTLLMKHFEDPSRRVQQAAVSAFCALEEEAHFRLVRCIDIILDGMQVGFERFRYKSLYLLFDSITILAHSVGAHLNQPQYVDKLMPNLLHKLVELRTRSANSGNHGTDDDELLACLDCVTKVIPVLQSGVVPYSEGLFNFCLELIMDAFMSCMDLRDFEMFSKESLLSSLDLLYGLVVSLKIDMSKCVTNSTFLSMLFSTMQDSSPVVRQRSIAIYGELLSICPTHIKVHNMDDYINIIVRNLDPAERRPGCGEYGLCNTAAWAIGQICMVFGGEGIHLFLDQIIQRLASHIQMWGASISQRSIHPSLQSMAITFSIIACFWPDHDRISYVLDCENRDQYVVVRQCCMGIKQLKGNIRERDLAYRGVCELIRKCPDSLRVIFPYFCDAVVSWPDMSAETRCTVHGIFTLMNREQFQEVSMHHQLPESLQLQLQQLYGGV